MAKRRTRNRAEAARRTRGSAADCWAEWIAAQKVSGLSIEAFCQEHGLSSSTFHYWRRRLRETPAHGSRAGEKGSAFVRLEPAPEAEAPVEAHLPCGTRLRVPAERLAELVRVLREEGR